MCGFTGFINNNTLSQDEWSTLLRHMGDTIVNCGLHNGGIWHDKEADIGLAHRRLSIVDLSPAGHQPMLSALGRYVIAFNGEIYNYLTLRAELEASGEALDWRDHNDPETLLASFVTWGIKPPLKNPLVCLLLLYGINKYGS